MVVSVTPYYSWAITVIIILKPLLLIDYVWQFTVVQIRIHRVYMFIFYFLNSLGDSDNYLEADPYGTPAHIVPEWYFLPFYALSRAIPNKGAGILPIHFIYSFSFFSLFFFSSCCSVMTELEEGNALCRREAGWVFLNICECGVDAQESIIPDLVHHGVIPAICNNLDKEEDPGVLFFVCFFWVLI